jgi:hypothetical protein
VRVLEEEGPFPYDLKPSPAAGGLGFDVYLHYTGGVKGSLELAASLPWFVGCGRGLGGEADSFALLRNDKGAGERFTSHPSQEREGWGTRAFGVGEADSSALLGEDNGVGERFTSHPSQGREGWGTRAFGVGEADSSALLRNDKGVG